MNNIDLRTAAANSQQAWRQAPGLPRQPVEPGAPLDFSLPPSLEAGEPPEARGLARDQVRLMVSHYRQDAIEHTHFRSLPDILHSGDLLVINTSGTLNAALCARRLNGTELELHLSTRLPAELWIVELRLPTPEGTQPFYTAKAGESLSLPGEGRVTLLAPYLPEQRKSGGVGCKVRLWLAVLDLPCPVLEYLACYGFPIRYSYVHEEWPLSYYQTVYATEPGSAEMPSAGRAFTPELITALVAKGVQIAPLLLHTGVASLEGHEPPYEEYYRVPWATAQAVNQARANGGRVIAVGTTSLRALETVAGEDGKARSGEGWTDLIITPERPVRLADGMLTGLHEPRSTHLAMLQALAGAAHIQKTYSEALREGYLWHEFGDLHLLLP
jgi:S-adenosylmethionine:tRNA ribosyltransferase-isomerase